MKTKCWWFYPLIGVFLSLSYAQTTLETFTFSDGTEGSIDWSAGGLVQAQGVGFPAGGEAFAAQEEINACRAARTVAQSKLLEIIQGVSIFGGITIADKNLVEDTIETRVEGVLRGATDVIGSQRWDAEQKTCALIMAAPLDHIRDALPPLGLSEDGKLIVVDSIVTPPPSSEEAESTAEEPTPEPTEPTEEAEPATESPEPEPTAPSVTLVAQPDVYTVAQGGLLSQSVLANDAVSENAAVSVVMAGNATHGTLTLNRDGSFTYQHSGQGTQVDYFAYRLEGENLRSEDVFVTINIEPAAPPKPKQSPTSTPPATTEPASETSPMGGEAPSPSTPNTTPPPAPAEGPLPTGIILDASTFSLTESFRLGIMRAGQVHPLFDNVEAYYYDSLEAAQQAEAVGTAPEIIKVSEVASNSVDVVLDEEASLRLVDLVLQGDFIGNRNIIVVGRNL